MKNPFFSGYVTILGKRHATYTQDVHDRLMAVKKFSFEQCRAALRLPHLQKTVRIAIERRMRQLDKQTRRGKNR